MLQMAKLYEVKYKYKQAEEMYEKCLGPIESCFGEDSLQVAQVLQIIGFCAYKVGNFEKGELRL